MNKTTKNIIKYLLALKLVFSSFSCAKKKELPQVLENNQTAQTIQSQNENVLKLKDGEIKRITNTPNEAEHAWCLFGSDSCAYINPKNRKTIFIRNLKTGLEEKIASDYNVSQHGIFGIEDGRKIITEGAYSDGKNVFYEISRLDKINEKNKARFEKTLVFRYSLENTIANAVRIGNFKILALDNKEIYLEDTHEGRYYKINVKTEKLYTLDDNFEKLGIKELPEQVRQKIRELSDMKRNLEKELSDKLSPKYDRVAVILGYAPGDKNNALFRLDTAKKREDIQEHKSDLYWMSCYEKDRKYKKQNAPKQQPKSISRKYK